MYNSLNGNLLSSRQYDTATYSQEVNRRSLLINSDGTAAYSVGRHLTTDKAFIFRYNPTDTVSTTPIWQK